MDREAVIIIGAGIGGLATAAHLSKNGQPVIIIEQTSEIGGRCATRQIQGQHFEIGALYLGGGIFNVLQKEFALHCSSRPFRCGVRIRNKTISFPLNVFTLWELHAAGVPLREMINLRRRMLSMSQQHFFDAYRSIGDVLDYLTKNRILRDYFEALFGVSGVSIYRLDPHLLSSGHPSNAYRLLNPRYPSGGNGVLPGLLFTLAMKNGTALMSTRVEKIVIDDQRVVAVKTSQGHVQGRLVVSNAGIRKTVLEMTVPQDWPYDFHARVSKVNTSLQVVNVFFTFSRSFPLPRNYGVFFNIHDAQHEFKMLEEGYFPEDSMFIVHIPSALEPRSDGDHRATLQFYYPRSEISADALNRQVERIMLRGLEMLFMGLSKAVTGYVVYDPARYEREFGFPPHVFGISADASSPRFPVRLPVEGLYCVGDSVAPEAPCVAQAMQSGLACAKDILLSMNRAGSPR